MKNIDERIDTYISKSAGFAQTIMTHLRQLVHQASPDIKENIKWGFPHFELNGIVCSMAAFKHHCAFSFWKASLLTDPYHIFSKVDASAMGQLGQIKELKDLPSDDILLLYIKEAIGLNQNNIKAPAKKVSALQDVIVPTDLLVALEQNHTALIAFEKFSNSCKKEYVEWITEAKTIETRNKRITTTVEWSAEGRSRNWKYQKK